ncbi:MAG: tRNA uridine-5-carboxymethylaminomethyl(34) synthesis GTPase MnmE [Prevotella sp.]|jgi:tRNA modification GTPase
MILSDRDTICAMATPAGGAIGIIRVSGPKAIEIVDKCFHGHRALKEAAANTLHYGQLTDTQGHVLDDVVASIWRAPHSYTGEDSVELSCHGSRYILQQVLHLLIDLGCRQAKPGEYTERAYLNGKMDLSQAEAIADLVAATNRATHKMALSQLRGNFSSELARLRDQLLKMTSLLELELDFSDHEELEFADRTELLELAETIDKRIVSLARSFETGNALKQGIAVAIVGKTNVGKSTLLNQLLHEDRAIVSNIHGTTRDVIEDTTEINDITYRFIDTAGLRHTDDKVEQMGIERTYQKIDQASIVLWLIDRLPETTEEQREAAAMIDRCKDKHLILVWNKGDLQAMPILPENLASLPHLAISAKQGQGIAELEALIYKESAIPEISENDIIVTNARHYESLTHAHESISRVIDGIHASLSGDLLAEDLRLCLSDLADITGGQITPQETLNNIFKHFCIGK